MLRFRPCAEKEGCAAYQAELDSVKCGTCDFDWSGYQMFFRSVSCEDDIVTEGLLRSAMNYCANRGVYTSTITPDMLSPAARRLGFTEDELTVDIPDALTSTECGCMKKAENSNKPE